MSPPAPSDQRGRPLSDLRISVTDRCNFRCPYCMPAELFGDGFQFLPRPELLSFEEITRVARVATGLGVRKLRITGGEPLLRQELPELIRQLAALPGIDDLALTTNGMLLAEAAPQLAAAGLNRVTVSLDALDPAVFRHLSGGRGDPETVRDAIEAAAAAGLGPVKVNCVVQAGVNEEELFPLCEAFRGTPHVLRFIEFMDVGTHNGWNFDRVVPTRTLIERIGARWPLEPLEPTVAGEVARRYGYADGQGEIGFITSVTQAFCGGCRRGRLSTEGRFVTCLFASEGIDLRTPLRSGASDADLEALLIATWTARRDRYSEERTGATDPARLQMFRLGG